MACRSFALSLVTANHQSLKEVKEYFKQLIFGPSHLNYYPTPFDRSGFLGSRITACGLHSPRCFLMGLSIHVFQHLGLSLCHSCGTQGSLRPFGSLDTSWLCFSQFSKHA